MLTAAHTYLYPDRDDAPPRPFATAYLNAVAWAHDLTTANAPS